jgi:hypothetical protein
MAWTADDYQSHIDQLGRNLGCQVRQYPGAPGMMYVELGYVEGPVIRNQRDYLSLLHELGHFALGHTQGRPPYDTETYYFDNGVLRSEAEAWEWALNECEDTIEYKSRRFMWDYCLGGYYQSSLELEGKPTRLTNGDRGHVIFTYDEVDAFFVAVVRQIQGGETGFLVPFPERAGMPTSALMVQVERYLAAS